MYNKYCWDNKMSDEITIASMRPLEKVAKMGSIFGNYQYGYTLYQKGKLEDCIKYLKYAADRDNYYACHFVGRALYDDSIGKYTLAKEYLIKSATHLDDADDQYDLAFLSDNKEATEWLEKAAKSNEKKYIIKVADLFRNGIKGGLKPNPWQASDYYWQGRFCINSIDDYIRIGQYYKNGDGIKADIERAYFFFKNAADRGSEIGAALTFLSL